MEQISGRDNILNHLSIPAACFTHPEISMVGLTEVSQAYSPILISSAQHSENQCGKFNLTRSLFVNSLPLSTLCFLGSKMILQSNFLVLLQPQAREQADKEGFEVSVVKTSFKANTKALAENEGDGLAKVIQYYFLTLLHSRYNRDLQGIQTPDCYAKDSAWVL